MKIAFLTTDNREQFKDYQSPVPQIGTAPEALLQGFALCPEAEIHVISCARAEMQSPSNLAPNIFFHSCVVPKIGWMSTFYQGTIRALRRKLRALDVDVVHGQGTERDCAMNAVFSGLPNVLTIHGNLRLISKLQKPRPFSYLWLASRLEALALSRTQGVVCITRYTQDAVSDLASRTWVVPNAVDMAFFDVDAEPDPGQPPRIIFAGLVCPRKNQNGFIRALDPLASQIAFQVVFLGQASPDQAYAAEFLELVGARPWCTYAGQADREQLRNYLRTAHLLVLPSLEDNCPMVVLEAMAAGLPVLASNVGGIPDLVEDGATGLLFDPLGEDSIQTAVGRALTNHEELWSMARRAKEIAKRKYHPHVIARQHLNIYKEVLARPS